MEAVAEQGVLGPRGGVGRVCLGVEEVEVSSERNSWVRPLFELQKLHQPNEKSAATQHAIQQLHV